MVRRIKSCCRCQRQFTSSLGQVACHKCIRQREQLSAVLPRSSLLDSTTANNSEILNATKDNKEPNAKRFKQMPLTHSSAHPTAIIDTAAATTTYSSNDDDSDCDSDSSDDSCADIPLSVLYGKNQGASASHPADSRGGDNVETDSQKDSNEAVTKTSKESAASKAASEVVMLDDSTEEQDCEDSISTDNDCVTEFPTKVLSDDACFICGSDLKKKNLSTGLKGRLNHLKRCAKKYGVSARDVKLNDDSELFVAEDTAKPAENDNDNSVALEWLGDAATDLALANRDQRNGFFGENVANQKVPATTKSATKQTTVGNFFKVPVRSLNNVLLAGAKRMAKTTELLTANKDVNASNGRNQKRKRIEYSKLSCPQYKKIPGTDFVCDGFMYAKSTLTSNYFLTHFHSDHYGGITKNWSAGTIYCSLETANLVHQKLGVDRKYLHPLGLMTPTIVESQGRPVSVTLMDANHCPGAVMFLFEVGKRRILHVGDFRWNRQLMTQYAPLRAFSTLQYRLDDLFLDTTYCDAKYTLPTQTEAIQATIEVAEREWQQSQARGKRALFLFGAYTIGKERIYLSVAERLDCKVYVDKPRYNILSALNWPRERMARLTTNKDETNLWVVPLGHINFKRIQDYLGGSDKVFSKKKYDRVIGFKPTGWCHSSAKSIASGIVSSQTRGNFTVHGVPYSEHSSFPELVDCLDCLKPKRIIPTVSASKSKEQVDLLLSHLRMKQGL